MSPGTDGSDDLTNLLRRFGQGDEQAGEQVMRLIYAELRRIAVSKLRKERPDHTLQPTALVNEAYVRLLGKDGIGWNDRAHFFTAVARVMRNILVDYARRENAEKHGGKSEHVELVEIGEAVKTRREDILAVHAALERLKDLSARQTTVVELRFFSGYTEEEIAEMLGVNVRTIKREWSVAKLFLADCLGAPGAATGAN